MSSGDETGATYSAAPNLVMAAGNGVEYHYRDFGDGRATLVLLQHFRGNLDNWDPALVDALAARSARAHVRQRRGGWHSRGARRTPWSRWPATRSTSSTRSASDDVDRARVLARQLRGPGARARSTRSSCAAWCSPRPHPEARPACTAGPLP